MLPLRQWSPKTQFLRLSADADALSDAERGLVCREIR
jgi:hypothetical protein